MIANHGVERLHRGSQLLLFIPYRSRSLSISPKPSKVSPIDTHTSHRRLSQRSLTSSRSRSPSDRASSSIDGRVPGERFSIVIRAHSQNIFGVPFLSALSLLFLFFFFLFFFFLFFFSGTPCSHGERLVKELETSVCHLGRGQPRSLGTRRRCCHIPGASRSALCRKRGR